MAELSKNIRRPGGDMVAARSPFSRRVLLPTEADLCNALGLTEEEYFKFLEGVAAKVKEKPEAYNLVPEIANGPLVVAIPYANAGALTLLGQFVVGIALTVVTYLLTPKPKSMKAGTNERTADIAGLKRFAPQFSFNSVQDLANLGDLVPLVFANHQKINGKDYGGVRVNSQLMWSQLVSLGRYQQLKLLGLFSLGEIEQNPDFKGYAIGDLLIENYHAKKIYTIENNIPFLRDGGLIPGDVFKIDGKRYFSGTRNPTTQATFGLSSPVPNATYYKLAYELVRTAGTFDKDTRPAGRITLKKRRKLLGAWPTRAGLLSNSGITGNQLTGDQDLPVNTSFGYQIVGGGNYGEYENATAWQQDTTDANLTMDPHGVDDINAATKTIREAADSTLSEGEQYLAGTALVVCENTLNESWPGQPWDGTQEHRSYIFKVLEPGKCDFVEDVNNRGLGDHISNPNWDQSGDYFKVKDNDDRYYYEQNRVDLFEPCSRYTLQRVNFGTISNNRKCDITEIGIKSKVFKQIQFANVNSKPTEEKLIDIYNDRSSLSLGNINKYINRYSFFKLQAKRIDEDNWIDLQPSDVASHSGLFCVKGNTPEFQYNYIRIDHPAREQYEFKFHPWPGAAVVKEVIARENQNVKLRVCLLNANGALNIGDLEQFSSNSFDIKFAGNKYYSLTRENLSNPEWTLGQPSKFLLGTETTLVTGLSRLHKANYDDANATNLPVTTASRPLWTKASHGSYPGFEGPIHDTVFVRYDNFPTPGRYRFSLYISPTDVPPNDVGNGPEWPRVLEGNMSDLVNGVPPVTPSSGLHYRRTDEGQYGGKFEPVLDSSLPHADSDGHPWGVKNVPMWGNIVKSYFYVKRSEQYGEVNGPVISLTNVATTNHRVGDDDANGITVNYKAWTNVTTNANEKRWYATWELVDVGEDYTNGDQIKIPQQTYSSGVPGASVTIPEQIVSTVVQKNAKEFTDDIESELNLYDAASDYWKYEGDQSSHLDGPEHQITYCNEIIKTEGEEEATYEKLSYAGLRINSAKEWTNFSQFSAYFKKGIKIKNLIDGDTKASNLFPDIAYALLTDPKIGAGKVISTSSVNDVNMRVAAQFCKANKYLWDGVVSSKVNLREFIFEQGMYCLLDFTVIGGQFSLYPSVPFDSNTFEIKLDKPVDIKAMFTDGNINDLNVAFLAPEDRQTFQANVIYRDEKENGFPENKSRIIRLANTETESHIDDPVETFDLSGFCTNSEHAEAFGKFILGTRKFVDHTITFKTAPHYIVNVKPGDYIRVFSTTQHVQRFNNGAILEDGTVVSKDTLSGNKNFYWWNPDQSTVQENTENFSNPLPSQYRGSLFTIKESESSDQCYKVESITFGEDGLVELSGSYAELTSDGKLAMLQGWGSSFFDVTD